MKKLNFALIILALALVGCDNPGRTRMAPATNTVNNGVYVPSTTTGGTWGGSTTGTTTSGTTTGSSTSTKPAGFESCNITPMYNASGIGTVGICQSTLDETAVAVKTNLTDTVNRTCLIPTYKDTTGSSTYLGQPQCFFTQENIVVTGNLYKTRQGFTGSPINSVMIMKERSLTAYFNCMDSYTNYRSSACPYGAKTNISCDQYARSYMNQLCNDFKVMNPYLDIRLRN